MAISGTGIDSGPGHNESGVGSGYSMHDQAKAGLSGPEAAGMGREGVSAAADARGGLSEGHSNESGYVVKNGYIYGPSPRTGTFGLLGKPSLTGRGVMTTSAGWSSNGFGGMGGFSALSSKNNPANSAYMEARRGILAEVQGIYGEAKRIFHANVNAANLPASYRDQLVSTFMNNPFDEAIPEQLKAGVNMQAMEDSLMTMNGIIGEMVDIELLGKSSLTTPETAFTELNKEGLTSFNPETGDMELSGSGMAMEFGKNFSGQVLGLGLKIGATMMGGVGGLVAEIMSELSMKPGQGTVRGFGNMVETYSKAQVAGLSGPIGSRSAISMDPSGSGITPVVTPTRTAAIDIGNSNSASNEYPPMVGLYGFGAPRPMAIDLNYGRYI